jgi:hypothetical protein
MALGLFTKLLDAATLLEPRVGILEDDTHSRTLSLFTFLSFGLNPARRTNVLYRTLRSVRLYDVVIK